MACINPTGKFNKQLPVHLMVIKNEDIWVNFRLMQEKSFEFKLGSTSWQCKFVAPLANEAVRIVLRFQSTLLLPVWQLDIKANVTGLIHVEDPARRTPISLNKTLEFSNGQISKMLTFSNDAFAALIPNESGEARYVIPFSLKFEIIRQVGFRELTALTADRSLDLSVRSENSDMVYVFEDNRRVFVNTGYLAVLSPYFQAVRARLAEMQVHEEFGLPSEDLQANYENFVGLIKMAHPEKTVLTDDNVVGIMELADRFLFASVLLDCEKYLCSTECALSLDLRIYWADQYSMTQLQNKCFSELTTSHSIIAITKTNIFANYSHVLTKYLFEKLVDIVEIENQNDSTPARRGHQLDPLGIAPMIYGRNVAAARRQHNA